jgi:hypothetical protein
MLPLSTAIVRTHLYNPCHVPLHAQDQRLQDEDKAMVRVQREALGSVAAAAGYTRHASVNCCMSAHTPKPVRCPPAMVPCCSPMHVQAEAEQQAARDAAGNARIRKLRAQIAAAVRKGNVSARELPEEEKQAPAGRKTKQKPAGRGAAAAPPGKGKRKRSDA